MPKGQARTHERTPLAASSVSGDVETTGAQSITGAKRFADLGISSGGIFTGDVGTATCTTNAATLSKMAGKITSESLTTAAGAGQDLTITNTLVAAADLIILTRVGGTNTGGTAHYKVAAGAGSFVITLDNKHASAAFNGTFIIGFLVVKA